MPQIHGHCDDRFAGVRDAFEENFTERGELGAAVTVLVDGAPVVDLSGAAQRRHSRTRPWERDTLVNVWSTGKGPTALCAHVLADRGLLDLDAPVADYWPEFAAHGKESVLVRHLLSHRSGVAGPRASPAMETPSFAATTGRGCGPVRRSSTSQAGGSVWRALSSVRETAPSWNSAGVAWRYTPSFFAAVAGFMVWAVPCDVMGPGYRP
ncbi:hypothetical protein SBADM41S_12111 [Streptomyces badius]